MNLFKMACLNSFIFLSALSVNAQVNTGTFHYAVRIPAGNQSCQTEADNLKNQFSTVSKIQVTSSVCRETLDIQEDGSPYKLYSLLLTYVAAQEIVPYSASFGTVGISTVPDKIGGIYDSYAACLSDIHVQTQNFQAATQLTAVDAYCSPAEGDDHVVYRLQIDGLGTRAQTLYVFNAAFSGQEDAQTKTDLENLIITLGGSVTKDLGNQVYYYAKSAVNLRNYLLGFFDNANECNSQLSDAQSIFTNAKAKNVIARCLTMAPMSYKTRSARIATTSYALEVINDSNGVSQDYGINYKYYSFGECMNDKARILADAGTWAFGAICSPSLDLTGQYTLDVFQRP